MPSAPEPSEIVTLRLRRAAEKAMRQGHPWLFSGAVAASEGPADAALARVVSAAGEPLAVGFHSPRSQIRARLLGAAPLVVDRQLFAERLRAALSLRRRLLPAETTGYRLLNAEGDFLPGWTIDRFGDVLVSQITVAGLERLREEAYAALAEVVPEVAILHLGRATGRREEGLGEADEWIRGEAASEAEFLESGLRFTAELSRGQKTGFYLDQRDSRRLAERLAGDAAVLDLFAHAGAFALYALRGGARRVVAVESSPRLADRAPADAARNALPAERLEWVTADVFADLRERSERFDLAICDPPPLARRQADVARAARAYKDLNRLALARVRPGGSLLTFTCSGAIDNKLFRQILFAAAVEAGVAVRLLAPLAAGCDHPVAITHPQGEYLKGWWLQVAAAG